MLFCDHAVSLEDFNILASSNSFLALHQDLQDLILKNTKQTI